MLASVCGGAVGEYYAPVRIGRVTGMAALYFDGIVNSHIEGSHQKRSVNRWLNYF